MFSRNQIADHITAGWLRVQKHPTASLYIYNYTAAAQYEGKWDEITLACRGLILNDQLNIIARPFAKFFNLGEREEEVIPNETFEVYEKMDGSLGILYWLNEKPYIATRGSFNSEQALFATDLLHNKYAGAIEHLDKNKTYLFEIIYPENRIVLDYGDRKELVLLAIVDNASGKELPLVEIGFPLVPKYDGLTDIRSLKAMEEDNKEGFVIKFKSDLRIKVKFEEYLRIHRIVTNVSNLNIWAALKAGEDLKELMERVPDEFYNWIKATIADFKNKFEEIEVICTNDFKILESRKETAAYFQTCRYPAVLFKMLDGKNYNDVIWKFLRPVYSRPYFKNEEGN